jgi:hypothetical protein
MFAEISELRCVRDCPISLRQNVSDFLLKSFQPVWKGRKLTKRCCRRFAGRIGGPYCLNKIDKALRVIAGFVKILKPEVICVEFVLPFGL